MSPTTGLTNLQHKTLWTLEIWFKKAEFNSASNTSGQALLDTNTAFVRGHTTWINIRLETNGKWAFIDTASAGDYYYLARPIGANTWHHLNMQRNANGIYVYCNGEWTATTNFNPPF